MTKLKVLFITILGVIMGMTSCKKNCPNFNESVLNWVPYQADDVIELYSQSKDSTIIFSIKSIEATHTTHYQSNAKCGGCDDYISITGYDADFHAHIEIDGKNIRYQQYRIGDTDFYGHSKSTNFLFEGKEYEEVMIFEKGEREGMFKKLIIAKNFGIIGLIDIDGNTWALQTNGKKLNTKKNIVIHNVSC